MARCLLFLFLCLASVLAVAAPSLAAGHAAAAAQGLHVKGNKLYDGSGHVVRFHGVNKSGSEYGCIQGWGFFDGPNDAASVKAMLSWHINAVRIPLNEDCWLGGIGGVKPALSGVNYRRAIIRYVDLLKRNGIYAELSLMWAAPGKYPATYQSGAPDEDHSPAMWASLAKTFKNNHSVILAPWGETLVNADCFLHGGTCEAGFGPDSTAYKTAGMQQAVDVMRKAGYTGPIAIPGIDYANNLSHWLSKEPKDPLNQLVAEAHVYGGNTCSSKSCFDDTLGKVAEKVPLILGETGQSFDSKDCGTSHISEILDWADAHGVGYEAWTWNTWGNCGALISNYDGTPREAYGRFVKARIAQAAAKG